MNKLFFSIALFLAVQVRAQPAKQSITLEAVFKNATFAVKDVPGFNAMNDGKRYSKIEETGEDQRIDIYNFATGIKENTLFDNTINTIEGNKKLYINNYSFNKEEDKILLFSENQNIYRRSVLSKVYVYDIKSHILSPLSTNKVLHASFSPDGNKVAYVYQNNLFLKDLITAQTQQITFDGEQNKIINGSCDWVYEEEFSFSKAYEWSKNGKYIAYYRFDESEVPYFTMAKYSGLYPEQYVYKYPKAGEKNSIIQIRTYSINQGITTTANLGKETDQYIPRIKWTNKEKELCIYRLNRLQNKLELLLTDAATGVSTVIYKEKNNKYLNIDDDIRFLPDGNSLLLASQRSGYNHLYRYNWNNAKITPITAGNFDVANLVGVDEARETVYYTAAVNSPLERNLYATSFDGKNTRNLTPDKGTHSITPCYGNKYFMDRYSRIDKVPVYRLINNAGKIVRVLEDNKELMAKMASYALGDIKLLKVKGATTMLNAWMITPPDFDKTKKYPVLMYQYSGPGSQEVADRFPVGNLWWHQLLAGKGYIILCVDGTGTGFRGEAFCKKTYLQLGKYESDDQIAVAKNIGDWAFVDKSRIGIWGWSYGGFMSSTCIMKGNDVFKAAIAVAPVTNWRYYDNIYTERYMRTPRENANGYDDNSPETMVNDLKGKFLLIHGTADDNVHFQNSIMLVNALIKNNKEYDSEYYPDKSHGISGGNTRYHLYRRMTNFIVDNL